MDEDLTARWIALGEVRWGVDDALMLVADEVQSITGVDPIPELRGFYDSEETHHAFLAAVDGNFARAVVRWMCARGWRKVAPETAPPFAVGLARLAGTWTIGLKLENGWWAFRMQTGAAFVTTVRRAWTWQPE